MKEKLERKIRDAIDVHKIDVINDSHAHKDHADFQSDETHFQILIVSDAFKDKSLINRHKMMYKIIAYEMKNEIHAMQFKVFTIQEYQDQV